MASSSTNPRGKRGRVDDQNRSQMFGGEPFRTEFVEAAQSLRFNEMARRVNAAQKFAHVPTLKSLFIYEGVKTLFKNIHWEGVLKLGDESFEVLTYEFLSSLTQDKQAHTISFRLCNQNHTMHVDQICAIVGAPTNNRSTFGTTRGVSGYGREKDRFWTTITGRNNYDSSNARAAEIIHPVLKVCYRILASVIFPQEDNNKASQSELEILWCMINCPDKTPHFGHWLIYKLVKLAKATSSGPIHCGGIVTIIAKHLGLRIPPGLATMRGERWLNVGVLTQMHVLKQENNITTWLVAGEPYLEIDSHNKNLLKLARRTSTMSWSIASNLGAEIPASESSEDEDDEGAGDRGQEDIPSSSSDPYAHYHRTQMAEMRRLHGSYTDLQGNYNQLHSDIEILDGDVRDLRFMVEDHINTQTTHNAQVVDYMRRQSAQQDAMFRMMSNLNTHFGASSSSSQQQQPPQDGQWSNWDQYSQQPPSFTDWRSWPFGPPNP